MQWWLDVIRGYLSAFQAILIDFEAYTSLRKKSCRFFSLRTLFCEPGTLGMETGPEGFLKDFLKGQNPKVFLGTSDNLIS